MIDKSEIEVGKCYLMRWQREPERANAKVFEQKVQILWTKDVFDRVEVTTNHRPWHEGGTGTIWLDQIVSVVEIPRGPYDR